MYVDIVISSPEIDLATVGELHRCLDGVELRSAIRLDFRAVTFCSAGAVRTLLGLAGRVEAAGGTLCVIHARPNVVRLLELLDARSLLGEDAQRLVAVGACA